MNTLTELYVGSSRDALQARREATRAAELMGFSDKDVTRVVTALSEILRGVVKQSGQARVIVSVDPANPRALVLTVREIGDAHPAVNQRPDTGRRPRVGKRGLGSGVAAARRLMGTFQLESSGAGVIVRMGKTLPVTAPEPPTPEVLLAQFNDHPAEDPYEALQRRNQSLLRVLSELDEKRRALARTNDALRMANTARQKALELEHAARERAEAAERDARKAVAAREEILRIVSHDLRNPLGLVKMSASLLPRLTAQGAPPERIQKVTDTIYHAVDRMERMIKDLLDVAAMDAGDLSLEFSERDLAQVVRETIENVAANAATAGVLLKADAPDSLPAWCDSGRVIQVLTNLVTNAIKYSPAGDTVTLALSATEDQARFEVRDNGPGIPKGERERIFDAYWQLDPSDPRGIGLGLSIAAGLVRAHNGTIAVADHDGPGATLVLMLPVKRPTRS